MIKLNEKWDKVLGRVMVVEECERCEGTGNLYYNPNLNPNIFSEGTTMIGCKICNNSGKVERPLTNDEKSSKVAKAE